MTIQGTRMRASKFGVAGLAIAAVALGAAPVGAAAPTLPGAPTVTSVTPGVRSVKVAFTKPDSDGGAKVTNYRVRCTSSDGGAGSEHSGPNSPIFVAGLTAGKTYSCNVSARNRIGAGPASLASGTFVPLASPPGAPTLVSATAGVGSAKIVFTKPAITGGAPITNYRAKCASSNGGRAGSHEGTKSPIVVSGLTAGKTYMCAVAARNRVGLGAYSTASDPVTPLTH
jgi:hypothetical protein